MWALKMNLIFQVILELSKKYQTSFKLSVWNLAFMCMKEMYNMSPDILMSLNNSFNEMIAFGLNN
jgi:hypothetical protein